MEVLFIIMYVFVFIASVIVVLWYALFEADLAANSVYKWYKRKTNDTEVIDWIKLTSYDKNQKI